MQIIDSTPFGVRSAYRKLTSNECGPTIHLFPMTHIGDADFYENVRKKISCMDLVLVEGVKSHTTAFITASYRYIERNPKLGLVVQPKLLATDVHGKILNVDVSSDKFSKKWAIAHLRTRLGLPLIAPFYGLYMQFFATRSRISKREALEMMESRADILDDSKMWEDMRAILLDWRDKHLIGRIDEQLDLNPNSSTNIAIIYGAAHIRAILRHLLNTKNYRVSESEWMDVIKL